MDGPLRMWGTLGKTDSSEVIDPIHGSLILSLAASDKHSYDLGSLFPIKLNKNIGVMT